MDLTWRPGRWADLGQWNNISQTWIVRPYWDDFPKINHDSRARENRARSWWNLPRFIGCFSFMSTSLTSLTSSIYCEFSQLKAPLIDVFHSFQCPFDRWWNPFRSLGSALFAAHLRLLLDPAPAWRRATWWSRCCLGEVASFRPGAMMVDDWWWLVMMNEWMNACMHAWMNEWMHACMNEWMNACMHEWMIDWLMAESWWLTMIADHYEIILRDKHGRIIW